MSTTGEYTISALASSESPRTVTHRGTEIGAIVGGPRHFRRSQLRERYGFAAVSGTEMQMTDGALSGRVSRYFDEHDKVRFVEEWCAQNGFSMSQVAAVGDSRSDVPLFHRAGLSIALNATPDARAAATHVLDTEDLRDVLAYLQPAGE